MKWGTDLRDRLLHDLECALNAAGTPVDPVVVRAEEPVEGFSAIDWLCAQSASARGYWSDRENEFEIAGTGRADMLAGDHAEPFGDVLERLRHRVDTAWGDVRYIGGFRFDERLSHAPAWDAFKSYRFILPRFEVLRRGEKTIFACNMRSDDDLDLVRQELDELERPGAVAPVRLPVPVSRTDRPPREEWMGWVDEIIRGIGAGRFAKVVLAREVVLDMATPIHPPSLLLALKRHSVQSFHFCFQPNPHCAFLGASPERLYRRDGDRLLTEAIAGTRARGGNEDEDLKLEQDLRTRHKDRVEHALVVEAIREALDGRVHDLVVDEQPQVLKLAHAQHLVTRFEARLDEGVGDGELLEWLHPTPAVGGQPRDAALDEIARVENFDRGWYAGPVGWVGRDAAQFVVGIRSGLVDGTRLHLFSGAGIVDESVPSEEWDEVENKVGDFLEVLPSHEPEHT